MTLLAIDTAGIDCAAALCDCESGTVFAAVTETIGKGHAERLMAVVDTVLARGGIDLASIGKIAVTVGPGSFTGIRVGVAAARGLGLALGVPVVGVTTLETMAAAASASGTGGIVMIDAKRDEVYIQVFDEAGRPLTEPCLSSLRAVVAVVERFPTFTLIGSGVAAVFPDKGAAAGPDRFPIDQVAFIGLRSDRAPRPLYLRGADAKPQNGFAVARA